MSDPLSIPLILEAKRVAQGHVVVGKGLAQVDFLREVLGGVSVPVEERPGLDDMALIDRLAHPGPFIYLLPTLKSLNVADDVRRKVQVWATLPVRKRTAAIRALVRLGAEIMGIKELAPERVDLVGDQVVDQLGEESPLGTLVWTSCWALTSTEDIPEKEKFWTNPWDRPWEWCPKGVAMTYRLNTLYKMLVAWTHARDNSRAVPDALGYSPAAYKWLQNQRISPSKVDAAIQVLSAWRSRQDDGYATALKIGCIFG